MDYNFIFLIVAIVILLLAINYMIQTAIQTAVDEIKTQITFESYKICRTRNEMYEELIRRMPEHSDAIESSKTTEPPKIDRLLYEVAKWAIECGRDLSISDIQLHFSIGYARAMKIVGQMYGMGLCSGRLADIESHAMRIDMEELMELERAGAFK